MATNLQSHRYVGAPVQRVDHLVDTLDPFVVVHRFPRTIRGHHRPVLRVECLQGLVQRGIDPADALGHGFILRVVNVEHLEVFVPVVHVLMVTIAFADFDLLFWGKRKTICINNQSKKRTPIKTLTYITTSFVLNDVGHVLMHLDKFRRGQQVGTEVVHHFAEYARQVG